MEKDTYSLFDDEDLQESKPERKALKIVVGRNNKLTKNQTAFNKLTKRIEQLQQIIKADSAKLESLLKVYLAEIPERKRKLASYRLKVAKALAASTETNKFGRRQLEDVRTVILDLCEEVFNEIEPDKETEAFYDAWAETSYRAEVQFQTDVMKREIAEHARAAFGVDIDPDKIEETPEGFMRFAKRLQNEFEENEKTRKGRPEGRRQSRKQLEREELQKQEEVLTLKSMRSIYLSLAKALHPDTIIDPAEKRRKEELMKKVTAAYAERDLMALLKLEMEWVKAEGRALESLPEDQLKLYIASLKDQVQALEQERYALQMNPRFAGISEFAEYPEPLAIQQIKKTGRDCLKAINGIKDLLSLFAKPASKKQILEFVKSYLAVTSPRYIHHEELIDDVFF